MRVLVILAAGAAFLSLSLGAFAGSSAAPNPKIVTLTEPVETEYGVLGRGRQLPFIAREFSGEIAYVRVRYLDHEIIVPLCSTDLHTASDGEPIEPADAPRRLMVEEAMKKRQERSVDGARATKPVKTDQIAAGYSFAKSYVSTGDYRLATILENIQAADSYRPSDQHRLGVVAGQWLIIDALANNDTVKNLNSKAVISQALDFAKERFHEMRQLQKNLGISDNLLFGAIHRDHDSDAKRQFDFYERWD